MLKLDAHVHLVGPGWVHQSFLQTLARLLVAGTRSDTGETADPDALLPSIEQALFDPSGQTLLAAMEAAGIDHACVFTVDYGLLTGEPGVSIDQQNKCIAQVVDQSDGRLTGFFSIDPRRPQATELFAEAVEDWGMRGLKLHPASGWLPHDENVYPLYQLCAQYELPLLIHTGGQPGPMKSRFGRPVYVDDVAADFPELDIIMAHCGYQWWEEALMVCGMKPNCHVDISGWQQLLMADPGRFYRRLRTVVDTVSPWRVLFGSDGPYLNVLCPLTDWVAAFSPAASEQYGVEFAEEEFAILKGRAAARLLGLGTGRAKTHL